MFDLGRSYRSERAAAKDIAVDGTTADIDPRRECHRTGRGAVVFLLICDAINLNFATNYAIVIEVKRILIDTGASTIYVTTIQPLAVIDITGLQERPVSRSIGQAHLTAVDNHPGVAAHMSVLTTAIDGGVNPRTDSLPLGFVTIADKFIKLISCQGSTYLIGIVCRLTPVTADVHLCLVDIS